MALITFKNNDKNYYDSEKYLLCNLFSHSLDRVDGTHKKPDGYKLAGYEREKLKYGKISKVKLLIALIATFYYSFNFDANSKNIIIRTFKTWRNTIKYKKIANDYKIRLSNEEIKNLSESQLLNIKASYKNDLHFDSRTNLPYVIYNRTRINLLDSERNPINEKLYALLFSDMLCYKFDSCGQIKPLVTTVYADEPSSENKSIFE